MSRALTKPAGLEAFTALALFLLISPSILAAGKPDLVEVLYICRWSTWNGERRDLLLGADPCIEVLGVPMVGAFSLWKGTVDTTYVNRMMRIYMPRSYQQLVRSHDMVVLHDAPCGHQEAAVRFDPRWIHWFSEGVQKEGLSLEMWGGDASWGGHGEQNYPSWGETELGTILPYKCLGGYSPVVPRALRPSFLDPQNPLTRLPWGRAPPIMLLNAVSLRQGAVPVADAVSGRSKYPWIAMWRAGKGRVLGETQVFSSLGCGARMPLEWEWWQDFLIYLVYYGAGKQIPTDIYRVHRLRGEINSYHMKRSMLVSLLDFVERFGADIAPLYRELDRIDLKESEAEALYRKGEYDSCSAALEGVNQMMDDLGSDAIDAKEKTLVWVYLVEWMSVLGVSLMAASVLWALMIRRKLYKEIRTTKASLDSSGG